MKKTFSTEAAYLFGILILALGTALMERADFGMSMVVAPAYLLHLKLSETLPFITFGMAEYLLQAVLLVALMVIRRRVQRGYFFSFVTAVCYGLVLDGCILLVGLISWAGLAFRIACYLLGMVLCSLGVALLFHTYISPEGYELFVKELSAMMGKPVSRVKTVYDCVSCGVGVLLSFVFFGFGVFEGVKLGTIFCALINGWLIGRITVFLEKRFVFADRFPLRRLFAQ